MVDRCYKIRIFALLNFQPRLTI